MNKYADVRRQDRMDAAARPNRSMERLAADLEKEVRYSRLRRILIFTAVLAWLVLLFGRSLFRQADILNLVYENAEKERRIEELKMSNSQLQEEIYRRTDLQAIEEAALGMGMIPSRQAPRILVPQVKNDEVLLRLESADAQPLGLKSKREEDEVYYNLEEYFETHNLAEVYFSDELASSDWEVADSGEPIVIDATTEAIREEASATPNDEETNAQENPPATSGDAAAADPVDAAMNEVAHE